ncbi:MAG: hypothetical protein HFF18_01120 [Oscillospiraceae bacterium]|nr:hypothetical protein [Oscillospiraceae bacterium]
MTDKQAYLSLPPHKQIAYICLLPRPPVLQSLQKIAKASKDHFHFWLKWYKISSTLGERGTSVKRARTAEAVWEAHQQAVTEQQ